ncbi:2-C-methyl-D-erythritol 4-phosphate cytidylyltransferase [Curvibacter sp. CHRR-16]|uniref:2-C-methyl-D-erythritol 4-phosphate cytidylyltransferase n=1 Tax=Curvibacter sp. CHRR-16 TaxID=2835872 RepID=UPI001BDA9AD6|nr:2-C-methyl-D-erythritol 4-phosphate cytidylyltransferase [Curvibacter sp. CHRR-16]MBT0569297.1 2-C-methyl-D-erythritol 4-phosphate cytidylyltransferase [Curvibacter sp. CHRR-16]
MQSPSDHRASLESPPTPAASPRVWVLIPCAGSGSRAGAAGPKQYQSVAGQPLVLHTLQAFAAVPRVHGVVVVTAPGDGFWVENQALELMQQAGGATFFVANCGGATRAESVLNGLAWLQGQGAATHDWVLVHDAARCLVQPEQINALLDACWSDAVGGLLALPLPDTLKQSQSSQVGSAKRVATTVARSDKWLAQTPQMFRLQALQDALQTALREQPAAVTDEASALEIAGYAPLLVEGSAQNFKVTYPQDFALADAVLRARQAFPASPMSAQPAGLAHAASQVSFMTDSDTTSTAASDVLPALRIGEGWDVHRLVEGRKLILGGVEIAFDKGLLGHSDADVLLHAITDAVLGAAGLGDIGRHFPDTDAQFKGADSGVLLREAWRRVQAQGYRLLNVDCTIIAQVPKLAPHMDAIRASVAALLGADVAQVNVKAKTYEKLGPVGAGEAMEARAVVLLVKA